MNKLLMSALGVSTVAIASSLFIFSEKANALSVACSTTNLSGSVACSGAISGNDSNSNLDGSFGVNGWTEWAKVDDDNGVNGGLTVTGGGTSGGFSLIGLNSALTYMVALKGGNSFSLYNLGSGLTSLSGGTWNTFGIAKGNGEPGPGLSHFTVYTAQGGTTPQPVPEPLTILGTGLALGLGGLFKSKQKQKSEA